MRTRNLVWIALGVVAVAVAVVFGSGLLRNRTEAAPLPVEAVERRDIAVTIEATGTVEPIDLVEVKSKASGQILRMPVEVGSVVHQGDLLAQIDTVDVSNQYQQALAALQAAKAKVDVSRAQKERSDELFDQQVITATEHEQATLDLANAQSSYVAARTNLDLARQRKDDATVRAPITGTVLAQLVSTGQVISSATSSVSGGTTLLNMADLSRIRIRAYVAETDIGNVRPGQSADVTVDAFPQRTFQGTIEKIEPQAVVQQSVTMFPVLVSISNERGLLLPGMNGEVTMLVDRRDDVTAVPIDAVRSVREIPALAAALGMDADSIRAEIQRQVAERRAAHEGTGAGSWSGHGDGMRPAGAGAPADSGGERAAMEGRQRDGAPAAAGQPGGRQWSGGPHADGRRGAGRGTNAAGAGAGGMGANAGAMGASAGGTGANAGGTGANAGAMGANAGGTGRGLARGQIAFVKTPNGFEPRLVRLGLSDFDYAEVLSGLKDGDQVALLGVAEIQAQRQELQGRIRQRLGNGIPGSSSRGRGGR